MKNSVWYRKLWRRKLENIPVEGNADQAWNVMKNLLDQQMPNNSRMEGHKGAVPNPKATKVLSFLMRLLPAAAVVGTIVFLTVEADKNDIVKTHNGAGEVVKIANGAVGLNRSTPKDTSLLASTTQHIDSSTRTLTIVDSIKPISRELVKSADPSKQIQPKRKSQKNATLGNEVKTTKNVPLNNPTLLTDASQIKLEGRIYPSRANGHTKAKVLNSNKISTAGDTNSRYFDNNSNANKIIVSQNNHNPAATALKEIHPVYPPIAQQITKESSNEIILKDNRIERKNQTTVKKQRNRSIFSLLGSNIKIPRVGGSASSFGDGFNYGWKVGYAAGNIGSNFYTGIFFSYDIGRQWYFSPELLINSKRTISGSYSHESYFPADSISPFTIYDSRKIFVVDIPVNIGYRVSKTLSLTVAPIISIPFKQTGITYKAGDFRNLRDTIMHSEEIYELLEKSVLGPKINFGASAGIKIQIRQFSIDGSYQHNFNPYRITSDLGGYKLNYGAFKIAVGFQLNKLRPKQR